MIYNNKIMSIYQELNPLLDGLVSYWSFDDGANDLHGSNNGNINGATQTRGFRDNGYSFDGNDDNINMGDIEMSTWSEITISLWFNSTVVPPGSISYRFASKDRLGTPGNFIIWWKDLNSAFNFQVRDGSSWRIAEDSSTVEFDGKWHHILCTISQSDNKIHLYIDNIERATDSFISSTLDDSDNENFVVGSDSNKSGNWLNGKIDEVGLWNIALSEDQISLLYNDGNGLKYNKFT